MLCSKYLYDLVPIEFIFMAKKMEIKTFFNEKNFLQIAVPIELESSLEPPEPIKMGPEHFYCPFRCGFKKTRTKHEMRTHIREHTGEVIEPVRLAPNQFACPLCSKTGKGRKHMYLHIRTHTGERPFKCPFCEFTASHKESCQRHIRDAVCRVGVGKRHVPAEKYSVKI